MFKNKRHEIGQVILINSKLPTQIILRLSESLNKEVSEM